MNTVNLTQEILDQKAARVASDPSEYRACMTIVKARLFTIQKLLNNEIHVPYNLLKVESVYLQFRLTIELLYLSNIIVRRKSLKRTWPRSEKEYQPSEIRRYFAGELDKCFPYPIRGTRDEKVTKFEFLVRSISEEETYQFFNECHQYLHEPNPYKKSWHVREAEADDLLKDAGAKLTAFWQLLRYHVRLTELDDGEVVPMICAMGNEHETVSVWQAIAP